jgi:hypothetical protein
VSTSVLCLGLGFCAVAVHRQQLVSLLCLSLERQAKQTDLSCAKNLHMHISSGVCFLDSILSACLSVMCIDLTRAHVFRLWAHHASTAQYFLQMLVLRDRSRRMLHFSQQRHVDALVTVLGLDSAHIKQILMISRVHADDLGPPVTDPGALRQYRAVLGVLNYLACNTRPDIAFAVGYLSWFQQAPTADTFARVLDVVLYVNCTAHYKLHLGGSPVLRAFCDAAFAQCTTTHRSSTVLVLFCGSGSDAWRSHRQPTVLHLPRSGIHCCWGSILGDSVYV